MFKPLVLSSLALTLVACGGDARRSVSLKSGADVLYTCDSAALADLDPAGGGFKFVCDDGRQLYLMNDTSKRKDGTLIRMELTAKSGDPTPTRTLEVAVDADPTKCESAARLGRKTGETPVTKGEKGRFTLSMSEPCGEVVLEVGDAKR